MRRTLAFACIIFILIISGCYVNTKEISDSKGNEIISLFNSGDKEGLMALFSKRALADHDIAAQAEEALAFVDGEIVGAYNIHLSGSESTTTSNLEDNITLYISVDDIETASGKKYSMHFAYAHTDFDNPDNVGVIRLSITDEEGGKRQIGGE
jgi:hypothetical protein